MKTNLWQEIQEEFDEKFPTWKNTKFDMKTGEVEYVKQGGDEEIKSFLKQAMIRAIEEVKLEKLKKGDVAFDIAFGYWRAIDDLEALKKKIIEEIKPKKAKTKGDPEVILE